VRKRTEAKLTAAIGLHYDYSRKRIEVQYFDLNDFFWLQQQLLKVGHSKFALQCFFIHHFNF
jgi:hypothetical protein